MSYPADETGLLAPQWVANYALGAWNTTAGICVSGADVLTGTEAGPAQIGYTGQIWLLGVFTTAFSAYGLRGELRRHRALGRLALWLVFGLNWAFTGLCVYESYVSARKESLPRDGLVHGKAFRAKALPDAVSQNRTVVAIASEDIAWQFLPVLSGLTGVVTQAFLTSHALAVRGYSGDLTSQTPLTGQVLTGLVHRSSSRVRACATCSAAAWGS